MQRFLPCVLALFCLAAAPVTQPASRPPQGLDGRTCHLRVAERAKVPGIEDATVFHEGRFSSGFFAIKGFGPAKYTLDGNLLRVSQSSAEAGTLEWAGELYEPRDMQMVLPARWVGAIVWTSKDGTAREFLWEDIQGDEARVAIRNAWLAVPYTGFPLAKMKLVPDEESRKRGEKAIDDWLYVGFGLVVRSDFFASKGFAPVSVGVFPGNATDFYEGRAKNQKGETIVWRGGRAQGMGKLSEGELPPFMSVTWTRADGTSVRYALELR